MALLEPGTVEEEAWDDFEVAGDPEIAAVCEWSVIAVVDPVWDLIESWVLAGPPEEVREFLAVFAAVFCVDAPFKSGAETALDESGDGHVDAAGC